MEQLRNLEAELAIATSENRLYDFIANHYTEMSPYQLKEVLLATLTVGYDNCKGDEDEHAYAQAIANELECRFWGED